MNEQPVEVAEFSSATEEDLQGRRDFLIGLGRWSKIAISVAVLGGLAGRATDTQAGAWVNGRGGVPRGGSWANGGGGGWANRRGAGGWANAR